MNVDGDLGRHLTLGNLMITQGRIPLRDLFSHTMIGEVVTPHEWLAQTLFASFERIFGFGGVIFLCALVIAGSFWLVFKRSNRISQTLVITVFVTALSMITSMVHWLARPHVFTFLFLAAWLLVLDRLREGHFKYWWIMPILMLLWVNLHGAFIVGFVT